MLRKPFYNQQWSVPDSFRTILFSTLSPAIYKGLETVLHTASLLKTGGNFDFEWHIAGIRGTEDLVSITERHLKLGFKENNIVFKGILSSEDLASGLLTSNCYVHPSHIENSPNSICEAMIVGVPVVAASSGGTSSMLLDGVEGILVQDGDPYLLAGAISELVGDTDKMKKFSKNGRERAQVRHNPDTILNDIISIYSLLNISR
jgi:glycosyltransferase involved in cell wall biosynthesis